MKNRYLKIIILLYFLTLNINIYSQSQTIFFEPYVGSTQSCNDYKDNFTGYWKPSHGSPNSTNGDEVRLKTKDEGFDAKSEGVFIDLNHIGINFQQNNNYRITYYYQKISTATNSELTFRSYLVNNISESSSSNCEEEPIPSVSGKKSIYTSNDYLQTTYSGQVETVEVEFTVTQNYQYLWIYSDLLSSFNDNSVNYLDITRVLIEDLGGNDPDSDGDGVPDSQDDCPNEYGPASNNGCPVCTLNPPTGLSTTEITNESVKINWSSVSGSNGYQSQYKKNTSGTWLNVNIGSSNTSQTITNLQSETVYEWHVRTKCSNGSYGSYSSVISFTTLADCQENLTISQNVGSSQTDIQESSNTITATNTVFSGGTAEYDAGNIVYLKPNFHAKYGANFRVYIEGCNATLRKQSEKKNYQYENNETDSSKPLLDYIKLYPNPTKDFITVESTKEVNNWILTDVYGKSYFRGTNAKETINITNLPKGIYFLKAILTNGKVVMKKVIKN